MSEIRYALRTLIKAPGPTIVMMLTLGVAVGAATVIYSVIDLVWHFVPARNQTRLVYAAATDTRVVQAEGDTRSVVMRTPASVPDLRTGSRARRRSRRSPGSGWDPPASPESRYLCA